MRNRILKYQEKKNQLPNIGIIFCGNRAVVTIRPINGSPQGHIEVAYGLLFWFRLKIACRSVFRKYVKRNAK